MGAVDWDSIRIGAWEIRGMSDPNVQISIRCFVRKDDWTNHTLTHYKGTMVCGFCPRSGPAAQRSFNRVDVFKRHLTMEHGVEKTPLSGRWRAIFGAKRPTGYVPDATGICSTCSVTFSNAQDFYEHLDDCLLLTVLEENPTEAINAKRLDAPVDDMKLSTDHYLRIKLFYEKSRLIDPRVQTHEAAEGVPIATPTDEELHIILDEESTERTEPKATSERLSTKTPNSITIGNNNQQSENSEDSIGPEAFKVSLQHKVEDDIVQVGMPGTHRMSFPALHAAETSGCTTDGSESFTSCSSPEDSPSLGKIASSNKGSDNQADLGPIQDLAGLEITFAGIST
ncbi:hypothetical protein BKA56DRAFT_716650 [Ilyonectria sp. MPI-CAGE-AT-0026]|nr:hypothetical protein BKA56DRAFT_716650 [Ilyonectria sp. MPI-CAGE-AT-0026]